MLAVVGDNKKKRGLRMADQNNNQLPSFFDKYPELKKEAQEFLSNLGVDERRQNLEMMTRFMRGEITWAEIQGVSKRLLKFIAKIAYQYYKIGEFHKAEVLFKTLAILDHYNWYFRAALGAVYQKQHLYEQAIEEYSAALRIQPQEVTSLVNRGQCHLQLKDEESALADFEAVSVLKLAATNPWSKRAQMLAKAILAKRGSNS